VACQINRRAVSSTFITQRGPPPAPFVLVVRSSSAGFTKIAQGGPATALTRHKEPLVKTSGFASLEAVILGLIFSRHHPQVADRSQVGVVSSSSGGLVWRSIGPSPSIGSNEHFVAARQAIFPLRHQALIFRCVQKRGIHPGSIGVGFSTRSGLWQVTFVFGTGTWQ
jgi:hypothetical protein